LRLAGGGEEIGGHCLIDMGCRSRRV